MLVFSVCLLRVSKFIICRLMSREALISWPAGGVWTTHGDRIVSAGEFRRDSSPREGAGPAISAAGGRHRQCCRHYVPAIANWYRSRYRVVSAPSAKARTVILAKPRYRTLVKSHPRFIT
jgi:hypothetical protein